MFLLFIIVVNLGSIWTKDKTTFNNWEVELWFRVSGRGRLGADGLAFFFSEDKLAEGPVFGSADKWKGLAIFFDSFDNDGLYTQTQIFY